MTKLITAVKKFVKSEDAPTMVEYGLLVALIAIVAAAGATTLGGNVKTLFTTVAGSV
jgi:pilus assembly protein Flp/PilA